jgi:hypothetical protein
MFVTGVVEVDVDEIGDGPVSLVVLVSTALPKN